MDDAIYQKILADSSLYEPTNGHRIIEINAYAPTTATPSASTTIVYRDYSLAERDILPWLHRSVSPPRGSDASASPRNTESNDGGTGLGHAQEAIDSPISSPHLRAPPQLQNPLQTPERQPTSTLRLVIGAPRILDRNIWPLPISSNTLRHFVDQWRIPMLFVRAVCHQIPIAASFNLPPRPVELTPDAAAQKGSDRSSSESRSERSNAAPAGINGLLLRTNLSWTWQYASAIMHDPQTNTTNALLLGLRHDEIEEFIEALLKELGVETRTSPSPETGNTAPPKTSVGSSLTPTVKTTTTTRPFSSWNESFYPTLLSCILLDKAIDTLSRDAEERRNSLLRIISATGLHGFDTRQGRSNSFEEEDVRGELDLNGRQGELNLDRLTQKLTSLTDGCAGILAVCKMQFNFIDAVTSFHAQTHQLQSNSTLASPVLTIHSPNPPVSSSSITESKDNNKPALQRLQFLTHLLHGISSKITYTHSSAQGQIQTMYSLIASRDSRITIISAESSRQIAEETRKLALLTRRDSTDMRIIAAVTLIFLPATFTATFFSNAFFNFLGKDSDAMVSSWIWVYVVITGGLTAIVLGCWWWVKSNELKRERARLVRGGDGKWHEPVPHRHHSHYTNSDKQYSLDGSPGDLSGGSRSTGGRVRFRVGEKVRAATGTLRGRQSRKGRTPGENEGRIGGDSSGGGGGDLDLESRMAMFERPYLTGSVSGPAAIRQFSASFKGPTRVHTRDLSPTQTHISL